MPDLRQIEKIVSEIIQARNAFVVEILLRGSQQGKVLEVFIDTDTGVTTEACAEVSREISQALDAQNVFTHRYHLVVSSPGIDRPLKFLRQYRRNVGRQMLLTCRGSEGTESVQGTLLDVDEEGIVLRTAKEERRRITIDRVFEARVKPPW
jgi:ribosome maturation factor RimP